MWTSVSRLAVGFSTYVMSTWISAELQLAEPIRFETPEMRSHSQISKASVAGLAAGVFFWAAPPAGAEDADQPEQAEPADQIVVVAHKDERSVREIAANVTVLSRAELNSELIKNKRKPKKLFYFLEGSGNTKAYGI